MIYENEGKPQGEGSGSADVPEKADELLDAARKRGQGLLERQKEAAGNELGSVAEALREAARKLEEKHDDSMGRLVEKGAGYVDRLSRNLRDHDVNDLLGQARRSFRERPALSLGLAMAAGFALGRVLRAGSHRVAESASQNPQA